MPSFPSSIPPKLEAVTRATLASFLAYCLALADIPNAVPPNFAQLIGVFGPAWCVALPHMVFILGAYIPSTMTALLFGLGGATALLAAATVSNGLFVAMGALWVLWCTGLFYGPGAAGTTSDATIAMCAAAILSLGSWQLVQQGLSVTISEPPESDGSFLVEIVNGILTSYCGDDQTNACWNTTISTLNETEQVTIPTSPFEGKPAHLSFDKDNNALTIVISGGLWMVAGFWKWSGLTNPLAVFRNFLIMVCWGLLVCAVVGRLFPPVHTIRKVFSRKMLPSAIKASVATLKANFQLEEDNKTGDNNDDDKPKGKQALETFDDEGDDKPNGEQVPQAPPKPTAAEEEQSQEKLTNTAASLAGGGMAPKTAFEPRLLRNPLECTWPTLKELTSGVEDLTLFALGSEMFELVKSWETERIQAVVDQQLDVLTKCATALTENEDNHIVGLSNDQNSNASGNGDAESPETFAVRRITAITNHVRENTMSWLNAMQHPKFTGWKNTATSYAPWIMLPLNLLKRLAVTLSLVFRPERWVLSTFIISVEFTLGAAILVIMEVYWPAYRGFAIDDDTSVSTPNDSPVTVSLAAAPNVYSGWNLSAYVLSTSATLEGSLEKGTLRALGSAVGGFLGWLACIVCSGSYDQEAPVNVYGLAAWLTVSTAIVAYLEMNNGPKALMGLNPDTGLYGIFLLMTQNLVALEVALGVGQRNTVAVNRIVATTSGVIMSMIIALLPPYVRGADPIHALQLLEMAQEGFGDGIRILLDKEANAGAELSQRRSRLLSEGTAKKKEVQGLFKDGTKLQKIPFFRADPNLMNEINALSVTGSYILGWLNLASNEAGDGGKNINDADKETFELRLKALLNRVEHHEKTSEKPLPKAEVAGSTREGETELLLITGQFIAERLSHHRDVLMSMKANFGSSIFEQKEAELKGAGIDPLSEDNRKSEVDRELQNPQPSNGESVGSWRADQDVKSPMSQESINSVRSRSENDDLHELLAKKSSRSFPSSSSSPRASI